MKSRVLKSVSDSRVAYYLLVSVCCLLPISQSACRQPIKRSARVEVINEPQTAAGGVTPALETKYFRGSIGSTLGLQVKLIRDGEKLLGSYYYQKIGKKIDLRGSIDQYSNVVLDEFDASGKQTGTFKGLWSTDEDGLLKIAGNWTPPNGGQQTAFSLHQEPIEFTGPVEIATKQIRENNKKLKYEIGVEYPQITGSTNPAVEKFNQQAKAHVTKEVSEFRAAVAESAAEEIATTSGSDFGIGYTVAIARDDLISVEFDAGSYYRGAAHPNSYSRVINFDLKNGKPLRLADLFKPGARYLQVIANYCMKDLKKQSKAKDDMLDDTSIQEGARPVLKNYRSWTITKKGLGVNFDSYQVGPYVAGPQFVMVPYSALKDIIKPDGPVAQYVK
ncbi:MAG: DUF3298 domain-containing protein [Pyrinomonadaceae bacterium]